MKNCQSILPQVIDEVYKNSSKALVFNVPNSKKVLHPRVIVLNEDGYEIELEVRYLEDSIQFSTNEQVYYEVHVY